MMVDQTPSACRFKVPVQECDVFDKGKLDIYRKKWTEWMSWYEHTDSEPHSIESQIQRMLFNDLAYRATVSVRESVDTDIAISARASTLAYLLDQGYVVTQVLAIQKLLDTRGDVISVGRLLKDVEKRRDLITREVYVSGDGLPYDYDSWSTAVSETDPLTRIWGIQAPGLARYAVSKYLHETFDLLSGKQAHQRTRNDMILKPIFTKLNSWISGSNANEISHIRNNLIAPSADAVRRKPAQFTGVRFSQIDELQRAIVRVERTLTDHILSIRVARDVVPLPPLGIFSGLDLPYAPPEAEEVMDKRWKELEVERNAWKQEILQELVNSLDSST